MAVSTDRRRFRRAGFLTRGIALVVVPLLAATLAPASPVLADHVPGYVHLKPQKDRMSPARSVPLGKPPTVATGAPYRPAAPVWPAPSIAEADLAAAGARSAAAPVRAAGTPVLLGEPRTADPGRSAHRVLSRARVQVFDRTATAAAGVDGLLLRVARADGITGAGATRVAVDYSSFASAYGADWASRLRLVQLPECALSTPQAAACRGTVLRSVHDHAARTVSADVTVADAPAAATTDSRATTTSGTLLALAAGTSSGAGDYAATSLQPSSTWAAGGNAGGFTWSYPMRVPPALGGPAPKVGLSYSSQSVDGRMAASNNQPSWVGEGFEFSPGYIERRYRPCDKDMTGGSNTDKTGDLCWASDNAVLSLNGSGGELLFKAGEEWRARADDGSRIQRKTGASNGDNNGEYWIVTSPDGTQYWFGGRAGSNAAWTVPVFGNDANEPCNIGAFAVSYCAQAWRWNLDHVVDPRGNTISYTYVKETNRYARNKTATDAALYDRGGWLDRIEYGTRTGSGATAPTRVLMVTGERCLSSCATHDAGHWPDVPWDQECTGSPCYVGGPTFWTTRRLAKVTTQLWSGSGTTYTDVESWTLTHGFPNPGDGTRAGLWLEKISHTGHVGGDTAVPDILFEGVQMPNRVDASGADWAQAMNWWRIRYVTVETGGRIAVTYSDPQCVAGGPTPVLPAAVHDNRLRCYPVKWTPEGEPGPVTDWMHKYVVTQVAEDDLALPAGERSDGVVTRYQYVGDPAWHHTDDDGLIDADDKTWSVWRGYATVRTLKGNPGPNEVVTETRYFRGMHGDKQPTGTRTVALPAVGTAASVNDEDAYAGMTREAITFNGSTEVSAAVSEPWQSAATATRNIAGSTVYARHTGTAAMFTRTARDNDRPGRTTETHTTFDGYGMAVRVDDTGDTTLTGDEQCTITTYEPRNTTAWLTSYPHRVQGFANTCSVADNGPLTVDDLVGDTWTSYDQQAHGTAPSKGLTSTTEVLKNWTPGPGTAGTPGYHVTATATYDTNGRVLTAADARGNTASTAYTHNAGGQLASTTVTNHLNWATTTTHAPAWGLPTSIVDPNSRRTDLTYDGLGRTTAVWLPGRDKTGGATASMTFGYTVRNNGATAVATAKLHPAGTSYITSYAFFDSFLRPRQAQTPSAYTQTAGRVITDTVYDSAGRVWLAYGPHAANGLPDTTLYPLAAEATMPAVTKTLFDPAGRPTASIFLSMGTEKWRTTTGYGGDRTDTTPPAGGTATSTVTDVRGQTTELRQYHGPAPSPWTSGSFDTTSYLHNRKNQLIKVTDAVGNHWDYGYDLRGRQTHTGDPDSGTTISNFNDAGDLTSTTDGRGEVLAYTHDSLGRKTSLRDDTATGPKRAEWTYDTLTSGTVVKGKPVKTIRHADPNNDGTPDAYVSEVVGYNTDYTPTSTTITIPAAETDLVGTYTYGHTYWADGSPSTTTLPDIDGAGGLTSEKLSYRYNAVGLPDLLKSNYAGNTNNTYVIGTTYTAFGEPTLTGHATAGASLVEQSRYYEEGSRRLTRVITSRVVSPSGVADVNYSYDQAGNITKISDLKSADHQCFSYDQLRRLTEAWTPTTSDCTTAPTLTGLGGPAKYWSTWTFDTIGNRLSQIAYNPTSGARDTTTYTHPNPGAPQPHTLTSTSGASTGSYTYDTAGNTKTRPTASAGPQTLTWDAEGHLDKAVDTTGPTSYLYDADGNRLLRRDPTGKTLYLPQQELRHTTAANTKATSRYYLHNGQTIAIRTSAGLTWLIGDHQNTSQYAITASTQAIATRRQTPYGAIRGTTGTWPTAMTKGFVGGTNDNTELTHLGAREYDPSTGRFISVDPIADLSDPQQLHGYSYANNSPITASDPSGLLQGDHSGKGPATSSGGSTGGGSGITILPPGDWTFSDDPDAITVDEVIEEYGCTYEGSNCGSLHWQKDKRFDELTPVAQVEVLRITFCLNNAKICEEIQEAEAALAFTFVKDIFMEVTGIADAKDCANGSAGGCAWTAIGLIPFGKLGKLKTLGRIGDDVYAVLKGSDDAPWAGGFCSFAATTHVLMADGTTKPIADITVGDQVQATNPETGQQGPRTVTHLWIHDDELVNLQLADGNTITTTSDHPFWNATDLQWQQADQLDLGDQLLTANGTHTTVTRIQPNTRHTAPAYNLTITDIHTYYVLAGTTPILVHNTGPGCDLPGHSGRHQFPGTMPGKSQFYDDVNLNNLSDTNGVQGVLQPNGNTRYVMRGQTDVGIDRTTGLPTNAYTVIRQPDGSVLTMFPGTSPMS